MLQKFLIKNLIQNTIHLGHKKNLRDQRNNNLLLGYRNHTDIINLNKTILNFLKVIPLLKTLLLENKSIIIMTNKQKHNLKLRFKPKLPIIYKFWLPGNLTNYKHLRKLKKKNFQLKNFPNLIFLLTHQKSYAIAKETNLVKIPLISINDSNSKAIYSTYPIPGNDNSIIAENFYLSIIQHIIFLTYIEKLKKFMLLKKKINFKFSTKKQILTLTTLFKIRQNFYFFKHFKTKKILKIKNKNFKNMLFLKKKFLIKKYKSYVKKHKRKLLQLKTLFIKKKIHKSKKYLKKKKLIIKKFKKFFITNLLTYYKKNYTLPRLDSNQ